MNLIIQGEEGSYSHQVAKIFQRELKKFKIETKIKSVETFEELFKEVKKGNLAVLPVENSIIGTIFNNYQKIAENNFKIIFSYYLKIEHCLVAKKLYDLKEIEKVISHPAAIEQCKEFLIKNNLKFESFKDTAGAAKFVKETNKKIAAIASKEAAKIYNLKIIKENIQTIKNNYTRFFLISKDFDFEDLNDHNEKNVLSAFSFELPDKPAALFKALMPFATYFINLKKIESNLVKERPFEYSFLLEAEVSKKDKKFKELIKEFYFFVDKAKFLGSFKELNKVNHFK